jgi:hypothetical protein
MRATRVLALVAMTLAVLMTAVGGTLDSWRGGSRFELTSRHAWHDGMFLLVLGIFLLML